MPSLCIVFLVPKLSEQTNPQQPQAAEVTLETAAAPSSTIVIDRIESQESGTNVDASDVAAPHPVHRDSESQVQTSFPPAWTEITEAVLGLSSMKFGAFVPHLSDRV